MDENVKFGVSLLIALCVSVPLSLYAFILLQPHEYESEIPPIGIQSGVAWLNETEYRFAWEQTWNTSRPFSSDRNYFALVINIVALLPSREIIGEGPNTTNRVWHSLLTIDIEFRDYGFTWHGSNVTLEGLLIYRQYDENKLWWFPEYGNADITYQALDYVWIVFAGYCESLYDGLDWATVSDVKVSAGPMWSEVVP